MNKFQFVKPNIYYHSRYERNLVSAFLLQKKKTKELMRQNSEIFCDAGPFCMNGGCMEGRMTCGKCIPEEMRPEEILTVDFPKLQKEIQLEENVNENTIN